MVQRSIDARTLFVSPGRHSVSVPDRDLLEAMEQGYIDGSDEWLFPLVSAAKVNAYGFTKISITTEQMAVLEQGFDRYDERDGDEDEDPQCVCGVYLSEHAMMGCADGFVTMEQWEQEMKAIERRAAYLYDEVDWYEARANERHGGGIW